MPNKPNKTMRPITRVRRVPRQRLAANMGLGGTVSSRYLSAGVATGAAVQTSGYSLIDPPKHSLSNDAGAAILVNYSNYSVRSSRIVYVPAVGTTTTGTIWFAYIDNPEVIFKIVSAIYSLATLTNIVQNSSGAKAVPVWEGLEMSMSRPPRRRLFNTDTTFPAVVDDVDRSVQGAWVWVTTAAPFATTVGTVMQEYSAIGENLQPQAFTAV